MYFQSLQALTCIFSLVIFFHHISYIKGDGAIFAAGGDMGVAFFFILSGFVMSQGYFKKETNSGNNESIIKFIIKRLSKIYPLHVLCLVGAIILKSSISIHDICNLLLLQSWIPAKEWYFSGNAVGWCLSDFLFFYAIFPFICSIIKSWRTKFITIYFAVCIIYACFIIPIIPPHLQDGIIYISPLTRLLDFIFGILLWKLLQPYIYTYISQAKCHFLMIVTLTALIITTLIWYACPSPYNLSILWWPSIGLLLLYAVSVNHKLLTLTPLVKFGDVSFSFYLIHVLNIQYFDIILTKLNIVLVPLVRIFTILVLTVALSFFIHYLFVIPVERFIRSKISRVGS